MLAPCYPGLLHLPRAFCSARAAAPAMPPGLIPLRGHSSWGAAGSSAQLFCSQCEQELELAWCCKSMSTFRHRGTPGTHKVPVGVMRGGLCLCSSTAVHEPLCLGSRALINFISAAALCMQELKFPAHSEGGRVPPGFRIASS